MMQKAEGIMGGAAFLHGVHTAALVAHDQQGGVDPVVEAGAHGGVGDTQLRLDILAEDGTVEGFNGIAG